jgi:S1-C subfamily serine protease
LRNEGSPPTSDAGIELAPLTEALARASGVEQGAVVSYVHPRGPAAGRLLVGDIIESVADHAVTSDEGVEVQIARTPPGSTLAMRVVRRGRRHAVELVTVDAFTPPAQGAANDLGLVLRDARRVGAEILTVQPGSAGARAGLSVGDVITHLDGSPAPTAAQVVRAFTRARGGSAVVVGIRRNRTHLVVALERP